MFPRGSKGWVTLEIEEDQEKEPQSTQKGEDDIYHPGSGTGVQPNIRSVFSEKREDSPSSESHNCLQETEPGCALGD